MLRQVNERNMRIFLDPAGQTGSDKSTAPFTDEGSRCKEPAVNGTGAPADRAQ